jgi:hypothetical protein
MIDEFLAPTDEPGGSESFVANSVRHGPRLFGAAVVDGKSGTNRRASTGLAPAKIGG